jgi:hypothetical protein
MFLSLFSVESQEKASFNRKLPSRAAQLYGKQLFVTRLPSRAAQLYGKQLFVTRLHSRAAYPPGSASAPAPYSRRKFLSICFPSGVRIDSGWNCTP